MKEDKSVELLHDRRHRSIALPSQSPADPTRAFPLRELPRRILSIIDRNLRLDPRQHLPILEAMEAEVEVAK